ncbi:up-regulator of cell proliferation-like [Lampetra planeri]
MKKLTLDEFYTKKISTNYVLMITGCDEYPKSLEEISQHFLRNIMRANPEARNTENGECRMEDADPGDDDLINPLDMITAVFLCADSFLQQVLMQKMSQCQFALPLLLPDSGKGNITFMLWAMRQIVKNWKLQKNASSMEESLVSIQMPFISFIRVGVCSVSKSKLLNSILSNEKHDFFVHREMECGDIPRKCSDGLVEMAMFCPCGKSNIDVFETQFSILNLRGDARDHLVQLEFLKANSNAMFILIDREIDAEEMPILCDSKARLFIIQNQNINNRSSNTNVITDTLSQLKIKPTLIEKGRHNDAAFTKKLRSYITTFLQSTENHETLEGMVHVAGSLNIRIDECERKCSESKDKVNSIMDIIEKSRVKESKQRYLPLQGDMWHKWAETNKEQSREVRAKFGGDPRVFVLTVLGVQSTGKSTLLNTMFGLQFTVSSGRCTRGAFMQLMSIDDELKQELECDFILVIDTEGLKAPELATHHDSYEHDNELATTSGKNQSAYLCIRILAMSLLLTKT